jgi:hypothetical protein
MPLPCLCLVDLIFFVLVQSGSLAPLAGLQNLQDAFLSNNAFSGTHGALPFSRFDPPQRFSSICAVSDKCLFTHSFFVSCFHFYAPESGSLTAMSTGSRNCSLLYFVADNNRLTGGLEAVSMCTRLFQLSVVSNMLNGSLAPLNNLVGIITLRVRGNQFEGALPVLNNLPYLTILDVSHNRLSGTIGPVFAALPVSNVLKNVDVSYNGFSDDLSVLHQSLPLLQIRGLFLSHNPWQWNQHDGNFQLDLSRFPQLSALDLSRTGLRKSWFATNRASSSTVTVDMTGNSLLCPLPLFSSQVILQVDPCSPQWMALLVYALVLVGIGLTVLAFNLMFKFTKHPVFVQYYPLLRFGWSQYSLVNDFVFLIMVYNALLPSIPCSDINMRQAFLAYVNSAPDYFYDAGSFQPAYLTNVPMCFNPGSSVTSLTPPPASQTFAQFMQVQLTNIGLLSSSIVQGNLAQFQQFCTSFARCIIRPSQPCVTWLGQSILHPFDVLSHSHVD